jgi:hypothetical protein
MKYLFLALFVCLTITGIAQKPSIVNVVTHNRTTIICNTKTGTNPYPQWGVFPAGNISVRKIVMNVTLGSPLPDSMTTAHWDYLDHIFLRKKGGVKGETINYELGRMLTPYGSIYDKGWNWQWKVDVTDFAPLLRDSVEIDYVHSGYESANVGWSLTINFEITQGPPVVTPLGITPLWNKGYKYGDAKAKIEDSLLPVTYKTIAGTALNRIRIQHTGHGMDKPRGCSEFCQRWRELRIDGKLVDRRDMWKDCGNNALYPQGGTWVYHRAYWCPGDLQEPDVIDEFVKPGEHKASLTMEPYTATDNVQAVEDISAYLFHYSKPLQKNDVAVDKVLVPNDEQRFFRLNPASYDPRFYIRNLGSEDLKSVTITYGTNGFAKQVYHWKGNLKFNQTAEVILPGEIQMKEGKNTFTVALSKPNGKADAWMGDNEVTTNFNAPISLPDVFVMQFKTNKKPADNEIYLTNLSDTLYKIKPASKDSNIVITDTVKLKDGLYELCLTDTAGDGLQFWAEPQNGDGYLRLFDMNGTLIHAFESDCGDGEKLAFRASSKFVNDTAQHKYAFSLYPRLTAQNTELNFVSNTTSNMRVEITVDGKIYEEHEYKNVKNGDYVFSLSGLPVGRIILEVFMDGKSEFKGRLNKIVPGQRRR